MFAIHSGNYSFSGFWVVGRENYIVPEHDHPEFLLQEGQSGGTDRIRKQIDSFVEDRSFASISSESLKWTILHSIMPSNSLSFLRMKIIRIFLIGQNFLSVEQFLLDAILERLYKLRIQGFGKFKIVLELHNLQIHRWEQNFDCRLKTMVKRSIEHWAWSEDEEFWDQKRENGIEHACQESEGTTSCSQRTRLIDWKWKAVGQCWNRNNCSFWHDATKRANVRVRPLFLQNIQNRKMSKIQQKRKVQEAEADLRKSLVCHVRTFWKVLARIFLVKCGMRQSVRCTNLWKAENWWKKWAFAHRRVEGQPSERSKRSGDNSAVDLVKETKDLGCVFQDVESSRSSSILRKSSTPIRCVSFTTAVLRNAKVRDWYPSFNKILHGDPH